MQTTNATTIMQACGFIGQLSGLFISILGLAVEGVTFRSNKEYLLLNSSIIFTVSWVKGTDVTYRVYFNGTTIYQWDFIAAGHVYHYLNVTTFVQHTYDVAGNITVNLLIGNVVGSFHKSLVIRVEPHLDDVLDISASYTPHHVPNDVAFIFFLNSFVSHSYVIAWCTMDPGEIDDISIDAFFAMDYKVCYNTTHRYVSEMANTTAHVTCNNHVSNMSWSSRIILQENITDLKLTPILSYGLSNEPLTFNISMLTGSDVSFNINYGDSGSIYTFVHHDVYSYRVPCTVGHIYQSDGVYAISVFAYNHHYKALTELQYIVQNKVHSLHLSGPANIPYPPGQELFYIGFTKIIPNPTNVTCNWTTEERILSSQFSSAISSGLNYTYTINFPTSAIGTNQTLTVMCYNLVSEFPMQHIFSMYEVIDNMTITFWPRYLQSGQNGLLRVYLASGSSVQFVIDYGDGDIIHMHHLYLIASEEPLTVNKSYTTAGNYSIYAKAYNLLSHVTRNFSHEVVVQNTLRGLFINGTNHTVWPPATILFRVQVSEEGQGLNSIHCMWEFGDTRSLYTYIDILDSDNSYTLSINTSRSDIGLMNTTVTCRNLISNATTIHVTDVELDAVILYGLQNNGTVYLTNATGFTLTVSRFGTYSCFHWNMGDGEPGFVYGMAVCEKYAIQQDLLLIPLTHGQMRIQHNYTYASFGRYMVTVFAFNHVSNDTATTEAVVLDWICFPPNITFSNITSSPTSPLSHQRCQELSIKPEFDIHCWKTNKVVTAWEVHTIGERSGIPILKINTERHEFNASSRLLPYGAYYVTIFAEMENIYDTTQYAEIYIEIIKCPLHVSMAGDSSILLNMNTTFILNAIDLSYDPDVEPGDKSDLEFTWSCMRTNSSTFDQIYGASMEKFEGCFRDGDDINSIAGGKLTIETNNMLPMSWHLISVTMSKDTRTDTSDKRIYVAPQGPPTIRIR